MIAGAVPHVGSDVRAAAIQRQAHVDRSRDGRPLTPMPFFDDLEHRSTSADAEPVACLRLDGWNDLLGQRVDHQWVARRRRAGRSRSARRRAASRTAFIRETIAARRISRCSSRASTPPASATTRDGFSPSNTAGSRRRASARLLGAPTTSATSSATTDEERFAAALESPSSGSACPAPSGSKPSLTKPSNGAAERGARRHRAQVAVAHEPLARGRMSALAPVSARCGDCSCRPRAARLSAQEQPAVIAAPTEQSRAELARVVSAAIERPARHVRRRCVDARQRADDRAAHAARAAGPCRDGPDARGARAVQARAARRALRARACRGRQRVAAPRSAVRAGARRPLRPRLASVQRRMSRSRSLNPVLQPILDFLAKLPADELAEVRRDRRLGHGAADAERQLAADESIQRLRSCRSRSAPSASRRARSRAAARRAAASPRR